MSLCASSIEGGVETPPNVEALTLDVAGSMSADAGSGGDAAASADAGGGADAGTETASGAEPSTTTMLQLLHAAGFPQAVEQSDGRCFIPVSNMPSALKRCVVVVESMAFACGDLSVRHAWIPLLQMEHAKTLSTEALLTLMATAGKLPYIALEVKASRLALCAKMPAFLPPPLMQMYISVLILTADAMAENEPELTAALEAAQTSLA